MAEQNIPNEEADVYAWAQNYVAQQRSLMAAQQAAGFKPTKPSRAAVTQAVQAQFGAGSGRGFGPLTWIRILFWVVWILMRI